MTTTDNNITPAALEGAAAASAELVAALYADLRRLAAKHMAAESGPQTLSATALVHEAWLRMGAPEAADARWENRRHFFGSAAQAMRRILIDRARNKGRQKRGGELERVDAAISQIIAPVPDDQLLALNDALETLAQKDPETAEIVNLHYFGGLSWVEIAEMTGKSERDLRRQWTFARAWLREEILGAPLGAPSVPAALKNNRAQRHSHRART